MSRLRYTLTHQTWWWYVTVVFAVCWLVFQYSLGLTNGLFHTALMATTGLFAYWITRSDK